MSFLHTGLQMGHFKTLITTKFALRGSLEEREAHFHPEIQQVCLQKSIYDALVLLIQVILIQVTQFVIGIVFLKLTVFFCLKCLLDTISLTLEIICALL